MIGEDSTLFRRHFPLEAKEEPAWGEILAAMCDVPDAFVSQPFGKFYEPNTYPVQLVEEKLRQLGHSRAAVLWALDYLIAWCCVSYSEVRVDFPRKAELLPPEIRDQIPRSAPQPTSLCFSVLGRNSSFDTWPTIARAVGQARSGLDRQDERDNWVKATGWGFGPGQFSYNGKVYDLSGKKLELLKAFARSATRRRSIDELRSDVWGTVNTEDSTVRGTISDLRNSLRQLFGLEPAANPIECVDGAYWLETSQIDGKLR